MKDRWITFFVGGILPGTVAWMPDRGSIEFLALCNIDGDCAVVVDAATDKGIFK